MTDRLLSYPELKARGVPHTRQHLAVLEKAGKFPRRVRISANRVGWWESEIAAHHRELPRGPIPLVIGARRAKQSA